MSVFTNPAATIENLEFYHGLAPFSPSDSGLLHNSILKKIQISQTTFKTDTKAVYALDLTFSVNMSAQVNI